MSKKRKRDADAAANGNGGTTDGKESADHSNSKLHKKDKQRRHRDRPRSPPDPKPDSASLTGHGSEDEQSTDRPRDPKDDAVSTGHLSILSKFGKYRAEILGNVPKAPAVEAEIASEQLQGLHPLPLPPTVQSQRVDPNSTLPSYLSQPTTVPTTQRPPFSSFNLPGHILARLRNLNITDTFPVQSALLPLLLPATEKPLSTLKSDLLVSAATGSGKTLSYLIPILSSLHNRTISRTYALIIVPTHELATQVQRTAEHLASGTSLKISTAVGTRPFDVEKDHIIANEIGSTGADILVATPGRLVEHLRKNPSFTLRYLQWLVVDEADRLLNQSFQDWVGIIGEELQKPFENGQRPKGSFDITSMGLRTPSCAADNVRKVILSATMTRDVGKLAGLKLRRPQLIAVDDAGGHEIPIDALNIEGGETEDGKIVDTGLRELTSLPSTLEEFFYPVPNPSRKPLLLSKLLSSGDFKSGILIFVKSNEAAVRLGRLLELLFDHGAKSKKGKKQGETQKWVIATSTSDRRKKDISANTAKFKAATIDILISTDLMARGVDLPNAQLVINYDSPRNERDYIHRVGRTARAGNNGTTWSLVEDSEAKWWWGAIGKVRRGNHEGVKKGTLPSVKEKDVKRYEEALVTLGKEVRGS
ncbi:hypothetical protein DRE_03549 [Drechslerella stenobrocha 248]|uniref:ATP-dependent RNA helicase n=1 Tax=Drechslerella stenobrocha 248 TaxID=1043628 RepID=W7IDW0_9PEZI|nr:hypothetical protein DRE_03549 [Drechslerella stenobrocha 248]